MKTNMSFWMAASFALVGSISCLAYAEVQLLAPSASASTPAELSPNTTLRSPVSFKREAAMVVQLEETSSRIIYVSEQIIDDSTDSTDVL